MVHPNDIVRLTITFTEADPCPGDHLDVTMPPQFVDIGDFSFPFVDPDGNVLGTATIKSGQLTVVLSDQVAGLSTLTLIGSYNQRISRDANEGQNTLVFPTSGGNVPVPITVLPCEGNCQQLPSQPSKFGKLVGDHLEMVGQTPAFDVPTPYTFTETLTSPGQEFDCPNLVVTARSFTGKDANGQPTGPKNEAVTITSCSATQIVGTSQTSRANSFARLFWNVQVTSDQVSGWTDELTITTTKTYTTTETVERQTGSGTGTGVAITVPPSTSTTTTPTPSTTSSTPSTPAVTPSVTPSGQVLASTGSSVLPAIVAALLFLALGAALLFASRRGRHS